MYILHNVHLFQHEADIWVELKIIKAKVVARVFHDKIGPKEDGVRVEMEGIIDA